MALISSFALRCMVASWLVSKGVATQVKMHGKGEPLQLSGNEDAAAGASRFSDATYDAIAASGNATQMDQFVLDVIAHFNMRVIDDGHLEGMLKFYDGRCDVQSYSALIEELDRGLRANKCFQPFLEPTNKSVSNSLFQIGSLLSARSHRTLPLPTWKWRSALSKLSLVQTGNSREGKAQVTDSQTGPLDMLRASVKSMSSYFASIRTYLAHRSAMRKVNSATLSEAGYVQVLATSDKEAMEAFVRRVLEHEGLKVTNEGDLQGMLKFYNGECDSQSYDNLVKELRAAPHKNSACGAPWLTKV
eukprot:TRINITY_DN56678_c0_g1_i1.p1 TRINITY_DN56678_c0_g1~~TRINITY_DN56678_c0_g1_i1.p1  ORF type:complete len:303 (-),score=49.10 TRINITY_DN56678_c0_g1_i1:169-1077(-)